jgi:2-keto-3-deoxy-L-rhamnonate aldolase RhmA
MLSYIVELRNLNLGVFIKLPSTQAIEIARSAGFDFCLIDLEHSQLDEGDAIALASHASALGFPALVRIPSVDRGAINRLLEAGAAGIQLSTVRTAVQVRDLRAAVRYAPEGGRSISLAHSRADYGVTSMADYLAEQRDSPPLAIAQIETAETEDPLEEIAAAGADAIFIGSADLRADLGLDEEALQVRVMEIAAAAESAGVILGAIGVDDPRVRMRVIGADLSLLRAAMASALETARLE